MKSLHTLLIVLIVSEIFAQNHKPDWVEKLPESQSGKFKFFVGYSSHYQDSSAYKLAWNNAIMQINNDNGMKYSIQSNDVVKTLNKQIGDSVHTEVDFTSLVTINATQQTENIRIRQVDIYQTTVSGSKHVYVLVRVPVDNAQNNENHEIYKVNIPRDASYRMIFPGWSQAYKRQNIKSLVLISSSALFVGGILAGQIQYNNNYNLYEKSLTSKDFSAADVYKSNYDSWFIIRNVSIVSMTLLYINVV